MAENEKLYMTRIKTPDGVIHYLKDIEAHELIEGLAAVASSGDYNDLINKPVIDSEVSASSVNAVQNKVIKAYIDDLIATLGTVLNYKGMKSTEADVKALTSAHAGDVWVVAADGSEWISKEDFTGGAQPNAWEKFGPVIDLSGYVLKEDVGELAYVDIAEGSFIPDGEIYVGDGQANYTPEGTVSAPEIEVELDKTNINPILSVGTLPTHGEDVYVAPTFVEGAFTKGSEASWGATVDDEMLEFAWTANTPSDKEADVFTPGSFTSGAFNAGSLPTVGEAISVATGVQSATASAPTFTGTGVDLAFRGTEGLITVGKPIANAFEKANTAAARLLADGYYNGHSNETVDAPAYYYVPYCSGSTVPAKFAALAGANDTFKFSIGNNSFIEDVYYKVVDGNLCVAAPIILLEDQKNADELIINSITSTNTSMLTVEQDTTASTPTYTLTQDGTKKAQAYINFDVEGVSASEVYITKKVRPLKAGGEEVSYGIVNDGLALYPFGYTTTAAAESSKYTTGEASYNVAAIYSEKATAITFHFVMA